MRVLVCVLMMAICAAGCKFKSAEQPELPKLEDPDKLLPPPTMPSVKELTIGDVEAVVEIRGTVAEESLSSQVSVEILETPKHTLTLTRAFLYPPYPRQLWLEFILTGITQYEKRPVVIRGIIYRQLDDGEEKAIGELNSVIGVSSETIQSDPSKYGPRRVKIDVLADLEAMPETMLVLLRAKTMLLPVETDTEELDPAETSAPPSDTTILRSNPVRIEFEEADPQAG